MPVRKFTSPWLYSTLLSHAKLIIRDRQAAFYYIEFSHLRAQNFARPNRLLLSWRNEERARKRKRREKRGRQKDRWSWRKWSWKSARCTHLAWMVWLSSTSTLSRLSVEWVSEASWICVMKIIFWLIRRSHQRTITKHIESFSVKKRIKKPTRERWEVRESEYDLALNRSKDVPAHFSANMR